MQRGRIRLAIDVRAPLNGVFLDVLTNQHPSFWNAKDLQVELAIFEGETLLDLSNISTIAMFIRDDKDHQGPNLMYQILGGPDINMALTLDNWNAGTDQNVEFQFDHSHTSIFLDPSVTQRRLFMVIEAETTDTQAKRICFGATTVLLLDDGTGTGMQQAPQLGENIVPGAQLYSGGGTYVLTVIPGKLYHWAPGANETSLTNGLETLTGPSDFIAQGATVTLNGASGQPVTAFINELVYLDQDQSDARYLQASDTSSLQTQIDIINGKLSARAFSTLALLRANTVYQDGWVYMLLGNSSRGDGQAAIYYFDSSRTDADTGGSVVIPNNITFPAAGRYIQFTF